MVKIESNGISVERSEEELKTIAGITARGKRRRKEEEIINEWAEQYLAQNNVDKKDKDYLKERKLFKEALGNALEELEMGEEVIDIRSIEEQVRSQTQKLNLVDGRDRVIDARQLVTRRLPDDFEIKASKEEQERAKKLIQNRLGAGAYESNKIVEDNLMYIIERIEEEEQELTSQREIKYPLGELLGAVDVSKGETRKAVYKFWANVVRQKESNFLEALEDLTLLLKALDNEEANKFIARYDLEDDFTNFVYIADFPFTDVGVADAGARLVLFIIRLMQTQGLYDRIDEIKDTPEERAIEENISGGKQEAMEQAFLNAVGGDSQYTGATISEDELQQSIEEYEEIVGEGSYTEFMDKAKFIPAKADPLLVWENSRNIKLVAIIEKHYQILKGYLEGALAQDDLTINVRRDFEDLLDGIEDTLTVEGIEENPDGTNSTFPFALPLSVLADKAFYTSYGSRDFVEKEGFYPLRTSDGGERIKVDYSKKIDYDNINFIKDFFNDLSTLVLVSDPKAFPQGAREAVAIRGTKGQGKTTIDFKDTTAGSAIQSYAKDTSFRPSLPELDTTFKEGQAKEVLKRFFKAAEEYYYEPMGSGMLPVSVPSFYNAVGGKVVKEINKILGNKTGIASPFFTGTSRYQEISPEDFQNIITFLREFQDVNTRVDRILINKGRRASDSLKKFGVNESDSLGFVSLLLYVVMDETQDFSLQNRKLKTKTILERASDTRTGSSAFKLDFLNTLEEKQSLFAGGTKEESDLRNKYFELMELIRDSVEEDSPVTIGKMVNKKLLRAHDTIRKSLGKETVYGFLPLTYDNIDLVIDKMHKEENLDLSHMEVENIVKSIDSHDSIGRDYGITADHVYLIKARFRQRVW